MSVAKALSVVALGLVCALALDAFQVLAEEGVPSEQTDAAWPCEQILVPEVSAAVVWDGPPVEGTSGDWQDIPADAELVQRLSRPRADLNESEAWIEQFAQEQSPEDKDRLLTSLFAGMLKTLNEDRRKLNSGILRYSRDQERRARILDEQLTKMVKLESDPSESAQQRLAELRRRVETEQRVFDDREKSIPHLCTRPRVVEQRLGEIARAIAGHLE